MFSRRLFMVIAACSLALLNVTSAQATTADQSLPASELDKGNQLLAAGDYLDAAQVFEAAIQSLRLEPNEDPLTLVRLLLPAAIAQAKLGNVDAGKAHFDAAFDLLGQVVTTRSRQNAALEYLDEAHTILESMSSGAPDWAGQCFMSLGAAYFSAGQMQKADELIAKAVSIRASTNEPTPLHRVAPDYPKTCLERQISGAVSVELDVDDKGRVRDVEVVSVQMWRDPAQQAVQDEACRKKLTKAAARAAREFRFLPQLKGGSAVDAEGLETTIRFEIEG